MTLNIDGFNRMPKNQSAKMYQLAISIKKRIQRIMLSAAIHTSIYVYAHETGFDYGLIIPGFWVRIPEGPPEYFEAGQHAWPLYIALTPYFGLQRRRALISFIVAIWDGFTSTAAKQR